jgi:hypothetical protein
VCGVGFNKTSEKMGKKRGKNGNKTNPHHTMLKINVNP